MTDNDQPQDTGAGKDSCGIEYYPCPSCELDRFDAAGLPADVPASLQEQLDIKTKELNQADEFYCEMSAIAKRFGEERDAALAQVAALVEAGKYIQPYIRSEMLQGRYPVPIPAIEALEVAIAAVPENLR